MATHQPSSQLQYDSPMPQNATDAFATLARKYSEFIDEPPDDRTEFLNVVQGLLAQLVAAALQLPEVTPLADLPTPPWLAASSWRI